MNHRRSIPWVKIKLNPVPVYVPFPLLKGQNLNVINVQEANVSYHETWYIDSRNTILNLGCPRKENMIIWDGGSVKLPNSNSKKAINLELN